MKRDCPQKHDMMQILTFKMISSHSSQMIAHIKNSTKMSDDKFPNVMFELANEAVLLNMFFLFVFLQRGLSGISFNHVIIQK